MRQNLVSPVSNCPKFVGLDPSHALLLPLSEVFRLCIAILRIYLIKGAGVEPLENFQNIISF